MDEKQMLWEKCVSFHGHCCGGLAIGFQAARLAMELLGADRAGDEELVCAAECDACGVDAIQVLLGCTVGKGNLLFRLRGKQAFSFYDRKSEKSVRLVLRPRPPMAKGESMDWLLSREPAELFDCKEAPPLPEPARIFRSVACGRCGEITAENYVRLEDGVPLCPDCYHEYSRFS